MLNVPISITPTWSPFACWSPFTPTPQEKHGLWKRWSMCPHPWFFAQWPFVESTLSSLSSLLSLSLSSSSSSSSSSWLVVVVVVVVFLFKGWMEVNLACLCPTIPWHAPKPNVHCTWRQSQGVRYTLLGICEMRTGIILSTKKGLVKVVVQRKQAKHRYFLFKRRMVAPSLSISELWFQNINIGHIQIIPKYRNTHFLESLQIQPLWPNKRWETL